MHWPSREHRRTRGPIRASLGSSASSSTSCWATSLASSSSFSKAGAKGYRELRRQLHGRRSMHCCTCSSPCVQARRTIVPARFKVGFDRARARELQWLFTNAKIGAAREHVLDSLFGFAERLGVMQRSLRWDIPLPQGALRYAAAPFRARRSSWSSVRARATAAQLERRAVRGAGRSRRRTPPLRGRAVRRAQPSNCSTGRKSKAACAIPAAT